MYSIYAGFFYVASGSLRVSTWVSWFCHRWWELELMNTHDWRSGWGFLSSGKGTTQTSGAHDLTDDPGALLSRPIVLESPSFVFPSAAASCSSLLPVCFFSATLMVTVLVTAALWQAFILPFCTFFSSPSFFMYVLSCTFCVLKGALCQMFRLVLLTGPYMHL